MRALQSKLFVNWRDGMRLSREHLVQQNNALKDKLRDNLASQLTPFSYGLVPAADGQPAALVFTINTTRPGQVEVQLTEASAVTPGGQRIEISASLGLPLDQDSRVLIAALDLAPFSKVTELFIVLAANPFDEVAVGPPDENETPPRYPFVNARYSLHLLPVADTADPPAGPYHMPIGRLRVVNGAVALDESYIAPSSILAAHPALMEFHQKALQRLGRLEEDLARCLQNINGKKYETPRLATARAVCQAAHTYLAHNLFAYRTMLPHQAPIYLVGFFSSLARGVYNALQGRVLNGKDEYINTVKGWFDNRVQGEIESQLTRMVNLTYRHLDANAALQEMAGLVSTLFTLFNKQAELGLEDDYGVGQKPTLAATFGPEAPAYAPPPPPVAPNPSNGAATAPRKGQFDF